MSEGQIAILAASIGAGATLLGVLLTQAFKVLTDWLSFGREKDERFRSEKRKVYANVIRVSDAYREACADMAGAGLEGPWDEYYSCRKDALAAAAELQLVGTEDMNIDYGEALDLLANIGWAFYESPGLNPNMQDDATLNQYSWSPSKRRTGTSGLWLIVSVRISGSSASTIERARRGYPSRIESASRRRPRRAARIWQRGRAQGGRA